MNQASMGTRRKPVVITVVLVALILVVFRLSTAKSRDALAADNFNIFLLVFSENNKKQDEFLKKIEKMQRDFVNSQNDRLRALETQNELLLEQVRELRVPGNSMLLREKLMYMVPYDTRAKFPAYIWQLWKHGLNDDRFDPTFREGQAQWAVRNPGFVHELFNDDTAYATIKHLYRHVPEVVAAYEAMPEVILKMDFFRYLILFAKGGVYADVDTFPLQPVPNWIPENVSPTELGLIVAVGLDSTSANWRQQSHRRLEFGNFVIQSKPGHPVLRETIAHITDRTLNDLKTATDGDLAAAHLQGSPQQNMLTISRWTGSGVWTDTVLKYLNDYVQSSVYQAVTWKEFHNLDTPKLVGDVLVLPLKSFASEHEIPKDNKISDPLAFVKHYSAGIWKAT